MKNLLPFPSGLAVVVLPALILLTPCRDAVSQPADTLSPAILTVGVKVAPPFTFQSADSTWRGISVDLWRLMLANTPISYEWRSYPTVSGLLDAVRDGSVDAGVAALSITPEREAMLDFTHPYLTTGLSIAVRDEPRGPLAIIASLFSVALLKAVGALVALLLVIGVLMWLFERRRNPDQFDPSWRGIGSGFWLSAVTMTTVGYGDKAPVTAGGRLVAFIWMFLALVIISSFTAAIASALTVGSLSSSVQDADDLPGARVGTVEGAASDDYLRAERVDHRNFPSLEAALDALAAGNLDAVVHDDGLLRYSLQQRVDDEDLTVLPDQFAKQYYGIALPTGSPYREAFNQRLLRLTNDPKWEGVLYEYLGEGGN